MSTFPFVVEKIYFILHRHTLMYLDNLPGHNSLINSKQNLLILMKGL